jgi:glycyl-tRNA synthetase beta chain
VPRSVEGSILSIGDKADTIAGMFALGLVPSGSKDPFALRRQANAIVKVVAEKKLPLRLSDLMRDARAGYQKSGAEAKFVEEGKYTESITTFFRERLEFYLKGVGGYAQDVVRAVLAANADDVVDAARRAGALTAARSSEDAKDLEAVCFTFKRIKNILKQAEEKGIAIPAHPEESLMGDDSTAEANLWINGHVRTGALYQTRHEDGDYESALSDAASLRPLLDRFFDEVMVMVEDQKIRANRLAILKTLYTSFSTIADFSEIVTE